MSSQNTLNLADAEIALIAAIDSRTQVLLEGDPGVGKTALVERVARKFDLPCYVLNLGEVQEVDIGGFPVVHEGRVLRLPLGPIYEATQRPCVLFLDDYRLATPPVQGVSFRLFTHKEVGDVKLHPGCVVVLAANPTDQTPGGSPLSPPARSRISIVRMRPTPGEIGPYFETLGNPSGSPIEIALRDLGLDFAATLDRMPDLLEIIPPSDALSGEAAWGCPRAWENGLRLCAALLSRGIADSAPVFFALLAGAVGEKAAIAFLSIRKLRAELPSVSEIESDPDKAKLPANPQTYVAILGVLAQVASRNASAAYVYANRLQSEEIKLVIARRMLKFGATMNAKQKHFASGSKARVQLQGLVSMSRSDTLE